MKIKVKNKASAKVRERSLIGGEREIELLSVTQVIQYIKSTSQVGA